MTTRPKTTKASKRVLPGTPASKDEMLTRSLIRTLCKIARSSGLSAGVNLTFDRWMSTQVSSRPK